MGLCLGKTAGGDASPPPCWPDLPPEIAGLVLSRLGSHDYRLSFAAVCPEWSLAAEHHSTLLPPAIPCINLGDGAYQSIADGKVRRFATPSHGHVDASFGSWLLSEHERSKGYALRDPFSLSTPAIEVPCRYYDRRNDRVILDTSRRRGDRGRWDVVGTLDPHRREFSVGKMIVLSPHLAVAMFTAGPFTAAPANFASFRPGSPRWSHPDDTVGFHRHGGHDCMYRDIELHRGKIFAVGWVGHLFAHELVAGDGGGEAPSLGRGKHVIKEMPDDEVAAAFDQIANYHLVISSDKKKLLMVRWIITDSMAAGIKINHHSMSLRVFEADLETGRWLEVRDLDGQVLFVGKTGSRALAVSSGPSEKYHQRFRGGNQVFLLGNDWASARRLASVAPCKCSKCRRLADGVPSYCVYDMISGKASLVSPTRGQGSAVKHSTRSEWFFPSV